MAFFCYLSALPGDLPVGGWYPRGAQPAHLEPHHGQDRARRAPRHPGRPQRAEGAHRGHQADQGQVRFFLFKKYFCFKKIFLTSERYPAQVRVVRDDAAGGGVPERDGGLQPVPEPRQVTRDT